MVFTMGTVYAQVEICDNGVDDDGDGLIDCVDQDCYNQGTAVCPQMECLPIGYQVYGPNADWNTINLITGSFGTHGDNLAAGVNLNAIGYSIIDNRIWGYNSDLRDGTLFVAFQLPSGDFHVEFTPEIAKLPHENFTVGDVDNDGHLLLYNSSAVDYIYKINIDPGSMDYLTIVDSIFMNTPANVYDFVFNPLDGMVYGVQTGSDLVQINLTTGNVVNLGPSGVLHPGNYGAAYIDKNGFFYVSHNNSGQIYRLDLRGNPIVDFDNQNTVALGVTNNGGSNDGAFCFNADLSIDLGDAPDSYQTTLVNNGPSHFVLNYDSLSASSTLMLGNALDAEFDAAGINPLANGDNVHGVNDEDGIVWGNPIVSQRNYNETITVTNNTGDSAYINAWIDFNYDGDFLDPGEQIATDMELGDMSTSASLSFTVPNLSVTLPQTSYARIRLCDERGKCTQPFGAVIGGEVEDYEITLHQNPEKEIVEVATAGNATIQVCVDTTMFPGIVNTMESCGNPINGTLSNINLSTGCVDYTPTVDYVGFDTACVVVCDNFGICDTTIIAIRVNPLPDTIRVTTPMDSLVTICKDGTMLPGVLTSILSCGNPSNGSLGNLNLITGCVDYTPNPRFTGFDTACVLFCDEFGFCDTSILFIEVECLGGNQLPNCSDFSPAIDENGDIVFGAYDLLTNAEGVKYPITVQFYNEWGGLLSTFNIEGFCDLVSWNTCGYSGQVVDFTVTNQMGSCTEGMVRIQSTPSLNLTSRFQHDITDLPTHDGDYITDDSDIDEVVTAGVRRGKVVTYCGYIPSADNPDYRPVVSVPCAGGRGSGYYGLSVQPDWIMPIKCDEENDTAEIIFRTWEVFNKEGVMSTLVDTIVVLRLPAFGPASFKGKAEDTTYCEIEENQIGGETLKRYAAWKQPMGLHDYELPYGKMGAVTYELPAAVLLAGYVNAASQDLLEEYLACVILKKNDKAQTEYTIGDIIDGDYIIDVLAGASSTELGYGALNVVARLAEDWENHLIALASLQYFPYVFLEKGDRVLSADGYYEEVTDQWFWDGNGNSPYWFAAGWPSIYGSGDCVRYCDKADGITDECVKVCVPAIELDDEGNLDFSVGQNNSPDTCVEICLDELAGLPHCGITMTSDDADWTGTCPKTKGRNIIITQSCWANGEVLGELRACNEDLRNNGEFGPDFVAGIYAIQPESVFTHYTIDDDTDWSSELVTEKPKYIISQWLTLIDTVGPIFDFCYPVDGGREYGICEEELCEIGEWDHDEIVADIAAGLQYESAREYEYCHGTVYTTESHDCATDVYVPSVTLKDLCSGVHSVKAMVNDRAVQLERVATTTDGYVTFAHTSNPIRIPFGGHGVKTEIRYEAADSCWNQSEWFKYIEIKDATPPIVVMDDEVRVSLTSKEAWVKAETFDEGSWDNCEIELILARRTDWWADTACVDLCPEGETYTSWDDLLSDLGFSGYGGALGGEYQCGDYDFDITALKKFLNSETVENHYYQKLLWLWEDSYECGEFVVHGWLYDIVKYILLNDNCSGGDVEHGNRLKIEEFEGFLDAITGRPGYGKEVSYLGGGWSPAVPFKCEDACENPTVELLVMDYWCNWGKGWLDVEVEDKSQAKVHRELADVAISCESYNVNYKSIIEAAAAYGEGGSAIDSTGAFDALNEAFGSYVAAWVNSNGVVTDAAGNEITSEDLKFYIKNVTCEETEEVTRVADTLHDGYIDWINVTERTTSLVNDSSEHYLGVLTVLCQSRIETQDVWVDLDDCGNGKITRRFDISGGCGSKAPNFTLEQTIWISSACELGISMFDTPADTYTKESPACVTSLETVSTELSPAVTGKVSLKADLVGALCNSLAIGLKEEYISEVASADADGPEMYKMTRVWNIRDWCSTIERDYEQLIVFVVDPSCAVVDTTPGGGDVSLSGTIVTEENKEIGQVEVKAVLGSGSPLTAVTTGNGSYGFNLDGGSQVSIVPSKNIGHSNGISTQDVIAIQGHVLQKTNIASDYKKIAADVDGNGEINGLDVLATRRMVMTPNRQFANNTSWRFFVNDGSMRETYETTTLTSDENVDFVGVKIGDVILSADASRSARSGLTSLNLNVADKALKAGEVYRVNVTSDNFNEITGMQYTLAYADNAVEIQTIDAGALNFTQDNYVKYQPGIITSSWSEGVAISKGSNDVLFTLVIKAKADVQLRDVLSLNDRVTMTEAYTSGQELKNVNLQFKGSSKGLALYQNRPNPYAGQTIIGFNLPEASDATLRVYDITGKVLKVIEGGYGKGYSEVRLNSSDLNATGVLYYQLDTDKYTATKKMVLMK
ncbi:hypothetical protein GCM10025777_59420 [Membranihabitans marinus]